MKNCENYKDYNKEADSGNVVCPGCETSERPEAYGEMSVPLFMANVGCVYIVTRVSGSRDMRRFLENLGFVPGTEATVISVTDGNVIVGIRDERIALCRIQAGKIYVQ